MGDLDVMDTIYTISRGGIHSKLSSRFVKYGVIVDCLIIDDYHAL